MSLEPPPLTSVQSAELSDQYIVSFGKCGALGVFTTSQPLQISRRDQVVLRTARGVEIGLVLQTATLRQARLLGAQERGVIMRKLTLADETKLQQLRLAGERLLERARTFADDWALEFLDVDVGLEEESILLQFVGEASEDQLAELAILLSADLTPANLAIRFENLTVPPESHGCGKPDCGQGGGGDGCTSCSTGGSCGTGCGTKDVDLRPYFAHLRTEMEHRTRTPLL